ncbi:MAG TPA: SpoIIE family protein phosphatase [Thermoanaerobaculia bacterium]|nr:SpoIIE family protein phosphatase [Thermoanaerobaculia bacterium]
MEREVDRTARLVAKRPRDLSADLRSYLVVVHGRDRGARFAVGAERALVGRGPQAAFRLDDAGVSGRHFEVWARGRTLWVEDVGSSNGTFVDDEPVAGATPVAVGSVVGAGKTLLRHELRSPEELERADELEADLARASGYVEAILPPPISEGPVRVEWRFVPSTALGGDAFGYRWLDGDRFALYLIDVSGHGTQAALHSVSAANALRHGQLAGADSARPERVLAAFNEAFPMTAHDGLYFTAWYGVYDRRDRRLVFASAGHPAPLLASAAGGEPERLKLRNPPIGMMPGLTYKADERTLAPGSRLYLFSDGVFELRTSEGAEWGYEELAAVVARPPVPGFSECKRIEIDVRAAMAGRAFEDDFSLVVATFGE